MEPSSSSSTTTSSSTSAGLKYQFYASPMASRRRIINRRTVILLSALGLLSILLVGGGHSIYAIAGSIKAAATGVPPAVFWAVSATMAVAYAAIIRRRQMPYRKGYDNKTTLERMYDYLVRRVTLHDQSPYSKSRNGRVRAVIGLTVLGAVSILSMAGAISYSLFMAYSLLLVVVIANGGYLMKQGIDESRAATMNRQQVVSGDGAAAGMGHRHILMVVTKSPRSFDRLYRQGSSTTTSSIVELDDNENNNNKNGNANGNGNANDNDDVFGNIFEPVTETPSPRMGGGSRD